jgi:hypothetical protein
LDTKQDKATLLGACDGADLSNDINLLMVVVEFGGTGKGGNKRHANQFDRLRRPKLKKIGLNWFAYV